MNEMVYNIVKCLYTYAPGKYIMETEMSKHTHPVQICPDTMFDLPIPGGLSGQLCTEQVTKLAKIQVRFAKDVSALLIQAYTDIYAMLDEAGDGAFRSDRTISTD